MSNRVYTQITLKFPVDKDRFRQVLSCIENRDRAKYRTQAEYVTAAVLHFEGNADAQKDEEGELIRLVRAIDEKTDLLVKEHHADG